MTGTPTNADERRCPDCGATDSNHHVMCNNCSLWWPYIHTPADPSHREGDETLGEWSVVVEALGDEPGNDTFATEDEARTFMETASTKWTHGNPMTLYRRDVTPWQLVPASDTQDGAP